MDREDILLGMECFHSKSSLVNVDYMNHVTHNGTLVALRGLCLNWRHVNFNMFMIIGSFIQFQKCIIYCNQVAMMLSSVLKNL